MFCVNWDQGSDIQPVRVENMTSLVHGISERPPELADADADLGCGIYLADDLG